MENKTKAQVLRENPEYKTLINAVVNQLGGTDYLSDIRNHGIAGGFTGFIYYSDTIKFASRNRRHIIKMLLNQSDDMGMNVLEMVQGFGMFRNNPMDQEDELELFRYLGAGAKCKEATIPNLMAWYAAEEVARMFEPEN